MKALLDEGLRIRSDGGVFEIETDDYLSLREIYCMPKDSINYINMYSDYLIIDGTRTISRKKSPKSLADKISSIIQESYGSTWSISHKW